MLMFKVIINHNNPSKREETSKCIRVFKISLIRGVIVNRVLPLNTPVSVCKKTLCILLNETKFNTKNGYIKKYNVTPCN